MKEIRIQAKSEAHAKAIMGAFQALGGKIHGDETTINEWIEEFFPFYSIIAFSDGRIKGYIPSAWEPTHDSIEAAIEDLTNTRIVKLNDEYIAEVTKDGIEVGCQTFTHEAVEELYKASVEARGGKQA